MRAELWRFKECRLVVLCTNPAVSRLELGAKAMLVTREHPRLPLGATRGRPSWHAAAWQLDRRTPRARAKSEVTAPGERVGSIAKHGLW